MQKFLICLLLVLVCSSIQTNGNEEEISEKSSHSRPDDPDLSSIHSHSDKEGHHDEEFDHDAVTGSHQETEEFKDLEPEEAKKRLGILFDRMDLDRNGLLTKPELLQWIVTSFKNLDRENSQQKIEEYDENHDRKVSFDEYVNKVYGHSEKELEDMRKSNHSDMSTFLDGIHLDKMKFELADANRDGFLDIDEFTKFMHPQNYAEMGPYELSRTLADFDKNKDGKIDLKEFLGDDKLDKETEEHEKNTFQEFDVDKNGVLEKSEIIAWSMPGFEKTAESEVEHLFGESDENKDKQLNKDEVIAQHELWVGSHATDYGKHLDDMKPHEEL